MTTNLLILYSPTIDVFHRYLVKRRMVLTVTQNFFINIKGLKSLFIQEKYYFTVILMN